MKNKRWQILRTDLSSYQKASFLKAEAKILGKFHPNVHYIEDAGKIDKSSPLILITNTHTQLEKIPKPFLKKCKLIVHPNSGHDNLTLKVDIPIVLGNSIRAPIVTEYILSSLFKAFCPIANDKAWRKDRSWERDLIREKKILLIGLGVIGKLIAPILNQLAPQNFFIHDPYANSTQFPLIPLKECKDFDIVIVCASLTQSSHHLINYAFLKQQNSPLVLINPARGSIVKEEDLIRYLQLKTSSNAQIYLDVFETEPNNFNQFKPFPQVNCTSHMAGVSRKLNDEIIKFELQVIKDFINHQNDLKSFEKIYQSSLLKDQP